MSWAFPMLRGRWRDKLNTELRVGASYYGDIDLRIASASDNDDTQIRQINRFVDEGVDLLIIRPIRSAQSTRRSTEHVKKAYLW